jgi:CRISPR/Cas system-associated protein Csx1
MIPLQITITGYQGKPATLFCAYAPDTHILVVSVESAYRAERHATCTIVSNNDSGLRDVGFDEGKLADAISAFYALQGGIAADGVSSRLVFDERGKRCNPAGSIDKDGINERGQKYRVSESITNGQMATLAACWYAIHHVSRNERLLNAAERFKNALMAGDILTL